MYPDLDMHVVLFELEERRQQAAMHRLARSRDRSEEKITWPPRSALGSALLRLGILVSGVDAGGSRPSVTPER